MSKLPYRRSGPPWRPAESQVSRSAGSSEDSPKRKKNWIPFIFFFWSAKRWCRMDRFRRSNRHPISVLFDIYRRWANWLTALRTRFLADLSRINTIDTAGFVKERERGPKKMKSHLIRRGRPTITWCWQRLNIAILEHVYIYIHIGTQTGLNKRSIPTNFA